MTTNANVYDSNQRRRPFISEFSNLWTHRGLIRLQVVRDLTVRYKRSVLGVWWTLLHPLLTMAVLWVIFSNIFRFPEGEFPYVVYLLAGITMAAFFSQGVVAAGSSIVNNAAVLGKVYVPAEVFSFTAALSAAVNFGISLIPLLIIQLIVGAGIPWTVVLVWIPTIAMIGFVTGLGLLLASAAVHFYDVLSLTEVLVQLVVYLAATFYPIEIVPDNLRIFIYANPLYSYVTVLRGFVYEGQFAEWWTFAIMIGSCVAALGLGVWVFSRSWKNLVVML